MKIEQPNQEFQPVTIILQTEGELALIKKLLGATSMPAVNRFNITDDDHMHSYNILEQMLGDADDHYPDVHVKL